MTPSSSSAPQPFSSLAGKSSCAELSDEPAEASRDVGDTSFYNKSQDPKVSDRPKTSLRTLHNDLLRSLQTLTPADDARFWAAEESSTAASSGSERTAGPARTFAWSAGAEGHASGSCHPCIFFPKANGCDNGQDCQFCHLDHESKDRHRRHLRRGHGRVLADSESKDDAESGEAHGIAQVPVEEKQDPEEFTFILPSALLRAKHPWPLLPARRLAGRHAGDQLIDETSSRSQGQRKATRRGGLRNCKRNSSSSSSAHADPMVPVEAEEPNRHSELTSVFTSFLAPLFGGSTSNSAAAAAELLEDHGGPDQSGA